MGLYMIKNISVYMKEFSSTDEKIINATFSILQKEGFNKATTKKIAAEAGVNEVTIFRNFQNKNNLIEVTKEYHLELFIEKLELIFDFSEDDEIEDYLQSNFIGLLNLSESDYYTRRCLGLTAPVFVILILPELWKNDTNRSFEVESAALFNLQKIVAARILLFSMVDLVLLTAFFTVSVTFLGISFMDLIVQFLIPMLVTCCICLRMFGGKCNRSLLPPVAACLFWLAVWTQVVLREDVYCKISVPVWMGVLTLSLCCLCYCAARMLKNVEFNYSYNS